MPHIRGHVILRDPNSVSVHLAYVPPDSCNFSRVESAGQFANETLSPFVPVYGCQRQPRVCSDEVLWNPASCGISSAEFKLSVCIAGTRRLQNLGTWVGGWRRDRSNITRAIGDHPRSTIPCYTSALFAYSVLGGRRRNMRGEPTSA